MRRFILLSFIVLFAVFHVPTLEAQVSDRGTLHCFESIVLPVALPGMTSERVVELVCESETPVTVYNIQQFGAFEVTNDIENVEFPFVLEPGDVLSLTFTYTPLGIETGSFGVLVIESDAVNPYEEVVIEAYVQVLGIAGQNQAGDVSVSQVFYNGSTIALHVEAKHAEVVQCQVVDVLGNVLAIQQLEVEVGVNTFTLPVNNVTGSAFVSLLFAEARCTKAVYFEN